MKVTKESHPHIHRAFTQILLCNGGVNRFEPLVEAYNVPAQWDAVLFSFEKTLAGVKPIDWDVLIDGEEGDVEVLYGEYGPGLVKVSAFLNAFFEGWPV